MTPREEKVPPISLPGRLEILPGFWRPCQDPALALVKTTFQDELDCVISQIKLENAKYATCL